jgi:hypothetical protein
VQNRLAVAFVVLILFLTALGAFFWATNEKLVFADAKVTAVERMCVPYDLYRAGKSSKRVYPPGWTDFGRVCTDRAAIMKVRHDGFWYIDSYWNVQVIAALDSGAFLRGKITTKNQPLVVFEAGEMRNPNATKGLKLDPLHRSPPTKLDGSRIKIGDFLPVSYATNNSTDLMYAPNEQVYSQYGWILLGCAVILGMMLLLFMPDGAPQTEEGRQYVQQMREKYWDRYTE